MEIIEKNLRKPSQHRKYKILLFVMFLTSGCIIIRQQGAVILISNLTLEQNV